MNATTTEQTEDKTAYELRKTRAEAKRKRVTIKELYEQIAERDRMLDEAHANNEHLHRLLREALDHKASHQSEQDDLRAETVKAQSEGDRYKRLTLLNEQAVGAWRVFRDRYDSPADVPVEDSVLVMLAIRNWRADIQPSCWRRFPTIFELVDEMVSLFKIEPVQALERIWVCMDAQEVFHLLVIAEDDAWWSQDPNISIPAEEEYTEGKYGNEFDWREAHDGGQTFGGHGNEGQGS